MSENISVKIQYDEKGRKYIQVCKTKFYLPKRLKTSIQEKNWVVARVKKILKKNLGLKKRLKSKLKPKDKKFDPIRPISFPISNPINYDPRKIELDKKIEQKAEKPIVINIDRFSPPQREQLANPRDQIRIEQKAQQEQQPVQQEQQPNIVVEREPEPPNEDQAELNLLEARLREEQARLNQAEVAEQIARREQVRRNREDDENRRLERRRDDEERFLDREQEREQQERDRRRLLDRERERDELRREGDRQNQEERDPIEIMRPEQDEEEEVKEEDLLRRLRVPIRQPRRRLNPIIKKWLDWTLDEDEVKEAEENPQLFNRQLKFFERFDDIYEKALDNLDADGVSRISIEISDKIRDLINLMKRHGEDPSPTQERREGEQTDDAMEKLRKSLQELEKIRKKPIGSGKNEGRGTDNHTIDKVFIDQPNYIGTISRDKFGSILKYVDPDQKQALIFNTNNSYDNSVGHWVAMFWDPIQNYEFDYFDPLADPCPEDILDDVKNIVDRLKSPNYLKFKENMIKYQSDTSDTCAWHCIRFILDRFRGKDFKTASGYSNISEGEKKAIQTKRQLGYGFVGGRLSFVDKLFSVRTNFPPSIRKYMANDFEVKNLIICRKPILKVFDRILNVISFGRWNQAKDKLGYRDLFHLYMLINGNLRLERNHVIEMYSGKAEGETRNIPVPAGLTFNTMMTKTAERVGLAKLNNYDPRDNNCQVFLTDVLKANGLGTQADYEWINQDTKELFRRNPKYVYLVSKGVTNIGSILDKLIKGAGF